MFDLKIDEQDDVAERAAMLEQIVSAYGFAEVLSALSIVCGERAEGPDGSLATQWWAYSCKLDELAADAYEREGFYK